MTGLDYAAWFVLVFLAVLGIAVVFFIGSLPGSIARKRKHPYAEAISIGGWVTMLAGGILWPLVLMWAYCQDLPRSANSNIEGGV